MLRDALPSLEAVIGFDAAVEALRLRFTNGAFRLERDQSIVKVVLAQHIPYKHGVYVIHAVPALPEGAFYVGRSGTVSNKGAYGWQTLPERLTKKQSRNEEREDFFKRRMGELDLEGLDIIWIITASDGIGLLPALVEAWLLQAHLHT